MKLCSSVLFLLFFTVSGGAQERQNLIAVSVSIASGDPLDDQVASYIKRELRAIKDVSVSDDHPRYTLLVTVMPAMFGNTTRGCFLSVTFLAPLNADRLYALCPEINSIDQAVVATRGKGVLLYIQQSSQTGPLNDLKRMCEAVVAAFDTYALEPHRQREQRQKR